MNALCPECARVGNAACIHPDKFDRAANELIEWAEDEAREIISAPDWCAVQEEPREVRRQIVVALRKARASGWMAGAKAADPRRCRNCGVHQVYDIAGVPWKDHCTCNSPEVRELRARLRDAELALARIAKLSTPAGDDWNQHAYLTLEMCNDIARHFKHEHIWEIYNDEPRVYGCACGESATGAEMDAADRRVARALGALGKTQP